MSTNKEKPDGDYEAGDQDTPDLVVNPEFDRAMRGLIQVPKEEEPEADKATQSRESDTKP